MAGSPFAWIDEQAHQRLQAGLVRTLRPRAADSPLLDLASNDYLGLAHHPEITAAAAQAARRWGAGATGSRLVSGTTELHGELERELADFCGFESALVFSSGYAANLAAVTTLAPHGSLVVSDAGNHASLIDGCRLARGATQVVAHADPDAVRKALGTHEGPAVAVSDTVFSVDGDAAPLAELATACREHGAALAALRLLRREPERAARAREVATALHTRLTAEGLEAVRPDAAVVSVRAPSPEQAVRWAADCRAAGLAVGCFRPPSVPDGISRLRLTARADLTDAQIEHAVGVISSVRRQSPPNWRE